MIEENRSRYEGSALQHLMKLSGKTICPRCHCCEFVSEQTICWDCGGIPDDEQDDYDTPCDTCNGEGRIVGPACIGNCDENGDHSK